MKLHGRYSLTKVLPTLHKLLPESLLEQIAHEFAIPCSETRKLQPAQLVEAFLRSVILRLPNQEAILEQCPSLGVTERSSLSHTLEQIWPAEYARELLAYLGERHGFADLKRCPRPRILIDSMPVTLPQTQRGHAEKINNVSKGCGVMWAFNLDALPGQLPVELLGIFHGGWNDTYRVRKMELIARGPNYIVDRGFYSLETVWLFVQSEIHFTMRAKKQNLKYEVEREVTPVRTKKGKKKLGKGVWLESDQIVQLGKEDSEFRSRVRLVRAWLSSEEDLFIVTDDFDASAGEILANYRTRGKIEVYHRFVKQSLGLAHLYSFDKWGIEFQVLVTLLAANLLFLSAPEADGKEVGKVLDALLKQIRRELGLWEPWKRNTFSATRKTPRKKGKPRSRAASAIQAT